MKTAKKSAAFQKKRAARFADYNPPTRVVNHFHKRPSIAHRGILTSAALRAISAVTGDQI